jgi:ketosteroid isomerase-like protein
MSEASRFAGGSVGWSRLAVKPAMGGSRQHSYAVTGVDRPWAARYDPDGASSKTIGEWKETRPMAGNGPTIIDLDRKRMHAMAAKDVATLNAVLADDLIYTHSSARLDTKQSLIGNMQSGATVYTSVEPSDVTAQDLGDAVVLTGIARIKVVSNGKPNAFGVRFMDVYAKRGTQWQMVAWQSTRLPE